MEIKKINQEFSVCQVEDYSFVNLDSEYSFIGKTDEEKSLVCITSEVPQNVIQRDDGWKAFRLQGVLNFSLIGILSKIAAILADHSISIFAVSTYNTDYILIKKENYEKAIRTNSVERQIAICRRWYYHERYKKHMQNSIGASRTCDV